jgi:phosphogluconate dehydratase
MPFSAEGGTRALRGNFGRRVLRTAALKSENQADVRSAAVFDRQGALAAAFTAGAVERDFSVVVCYQRPRVNGMAELHRLTPILGVLLERGFKVALVTDGRLSGTTGSAPAAIHVPPECVARGPPSAFAAAI